MYQRANVVAKRVLGIAGNIGLRVWMLNAYLHLLYEAFYFSLCPFKYQDKKQVYASTP
jgi:hypothetical protein